VQICIHHLQVKENVVSVRKYGIERLSGRHPARIQRGMHSEFVQSFEEIADEPILAQRLAARDRHPASESAVVLEVLD